MKCDKSKDSLLDYFYEELSPDERAEFEEHLSGCAACQKELQTIGQSAGILRAFPEEEPNLNLTFVEARSSLWASLKANWLGRLSPRKLVVGFSVSFAALLLLLSLFNFEASYSGGDFKIRMSVVPRTAGETAKPSESADPLGAPITMRQFNAWKQDYLKTVQDMILESELRQRRDNTLLLTDLAQELELQRRRDLLLVGQGLEVFQQTNESELRRTQQVLHQLLQASYLQQTQPEDLEETEGKLERK